MGTWTSRGLRGSALEDYINHTNEYYRTKGLALIQKIPTPITPVRIDKEQRISPLRILISAVLLIISALYRESRFALTQRNVRPEPFLSRMCISIR